MPAGMSNPPFPVMSVQNASNAGAYFTASPGGEPGLTSGVWGVGVVVNYSTEPDFYQIPCGRANGTGGAGWYFSMNFDTGIITFYASNSSGTGTAISTSYVTPQSLRGALVVVQGIVDLNSGNKYLWVDRVVRASGAQSGYLAHSGAEGLGALDTGYAHIIKGNGVVSKWSWSNATMPTTAQIESHFDDIYKFGGCPATLQGVTLRGRYNLRNDFAKEISAGAFPTSPATIRDQVGSQNFTRAGATLTGTPYRFTKKVGPQRVEYGENLNVSNSGWPFGYNDMTLAELDAWVDASTPFSRYKASSATISGGKVTQFNDLISTRHLVQPDTTYQVATPTVDAGLNGATSATFSAHSYMGTGSTTPWRFMNDGTGCTQMHIIYPTTPDAFGAPVLWNFGYSSPTGSVKPGSIAPAVPVSAGFLTEPGTYAYGVSANFPSTPVFNVGFYIIHTWADTGAQNPNMFFSRRDSIPTVVDQVTAPPVATDFDQPPQLGCRYPGNIGAGGNLYQGRWAESIFWNRRFTPREMYILRAWCQKKFGLG